MELLFIKSNCDGSNHGTNNFIFEIEKNDGEKQYITINRFETLADLHLKTRLSFSNENNNINNLVLY